MTLQETGVVMDVLQTSYPRFYAGADAPDEKKTMALWAEMFAEDDFRLVLAAVKAFIATDTKGFPPHIGAIKGKLRNLTEAKKDTGQEAWGKVYKAICNSGYNAEREFASLPPLLQGLVGAPQQLREWAMMDSDTVQSVIASNFQRSYRERAKHDRDFQALPRDVQEIARSLADGMAMPELEGAKR